MLVFKITEAAWNKFEDDEKRIWQTIRTDHSVYAVQIRYLLVKLLKSRGLTEPQIVEDNHTWNIKDWDCAWYQGVDVPKLSDEEIAEMKEAASLAWSVETLRANKRRQHV